MKINISIIFDNLGPYHVARLNALNKICELQVIELYGASHDYSWQPTETVSFKKTTLDNIKSDGKDSLTALRRALSIQRPDVVFIPGWSSRAALGALAWCRKYGVPTVVMSDSQLHDSSRSAWSEWIKSFIVKRFSGALVAGSSHAEYVSVLGMPGSSIRLGFDVVDNIYFAAGAALARSDPTLYRNSLSLPDHYFLVSSRFIEKKNLVRLLKAFKQYRQSCLPPNTWDLVIIGDGPMRPILERQISESGLQEAVHLLGFQQYGETPKILGLAGALVLASTSEQWGLVVNEAMAASLPVLVSERCGCAPDLVTAGENGFTFDPEDEEALSHLLLKISSTTDRELERMGAVGVQKIEKYTPETFATSAIDLAQQILRRSHKPSIDSFAVSMLARTRGRN